MPTAQVPFSRRQILKAGVLGAGFSLGGYLRLKAESQAPDDGRSAVLVFLGDGFGDSDFDDMVVGVGVFAVPVPPAAILLLTGLFGLGALKRMRRGGVA